MKALSIKPPYAMEVLLGQKTIEYRTWKTDYRGPLLICASSTKKPGFISGHALCIVDLKDIRWDYDCYAWKLANVQYIKPFEVKGKLHLYEVPDRLIHTVQNTPESLTRYYGPIVYHGRDNIAAPWEGKGRNKPIRPNGYYLNQRLKQVNH